MTPEFIQIKLNLSLAACRRASRGSRQLAGALIRAELSRQIWIRPFWATQKVFQTTRNFIIFMCQYARNSSHSDICYSIAACHFKMMLWLWSGAHLATQTCTKLEPQHDLRFHCNIPHQNTAVARAWGTSSKVHLLQFLLLS